MNYPLNFNGLLVAEIKLKVKDNFFFSRQSCYDFT